MDKALLAALYYSAAVGVLSCLVSESQIMAPFRDKVNWGLLFCPICLGFWFALPTLFTGGIWFYFAVVACSNIWMLIILKVYESLESTGE